MTDAPYIAAIGGANVDIHGRPTRTLRINDSNPGSVHSSPGGVARNIAENLARLGANCRLITALGNDHHGQLLMQQCQAAGVDMRYVQHIESAHTSTYLSVLDGSGDMHVAINDMAIIEELGPELLRAEETMLRQAALIILDTNLCNEALAWLAGTFTDQTLFVDAVSAIKASRIKPYLNSIHTLKTSQIEAEALTGLEAETQSDLQRLAAWVHERGVVRLFVTLGERGVFYSTGEAQGVEKMAREEHTIRSTGGAGDAFSAATAYAWLADWSLMRSLRFALAAAEVTLLDNATTSPAMSLAAVNRVYERQYAH